METKFQTSFIPKKPLVAEASVHTHGSTSILMIIGTLLFIVSLVLAGLTFVGKTLLLKVQDQSKINLAENEKRFNLPLIEDLKKANLKIDLAGQLLKNHIAVSEALAIVGGLTVDRVRFSSFEFSSGVDTPASAAAPSSQTSGPVFKIKMKGIADTFNSVAWQSDVFGRSQKYGTNKVLKNPILSDLSVDASGSVNFNFAADIVPADISYEKVLAATLQAEGSVAAPGDASTPTQ